MILQVNGKQLEAEYQLTLETLLGQLNYEVDFFAVALNQKFIPRNQYPKVELQENDRVDILTPMQGG